MSFSFERKINYYETDKMGIVHHSNYIRFLEEARCEMLVYSHMPYSEYEKNGIMIPVLAVNLTFKRYVTFDDVIIIKPAVKSFNGVRLVMEYVVLNKKDGELVLTAETKHCFTDSNLKPINLKKSFPDFFEKFKVLESENEN